VNSTNQEKEISKIKLKRKCKTPLTLFSNHASYRLEIERVNRNELGTELNENVKWIGSKELGEWGFWWMRVVVFKWNWIWTIARFFFTWASRF